MFPRLLFFQSQIIYAISSGIYLRDLDIFVVNSHEAFDFNNDGCDVTWLMTPREWMYNNVQRASRRQQHWRRFEITPPDVVSAFCVNTSDVGSRSALDLLLLIIVNNEVGRPLCNSSSSPVICVSVGLSMGDVCCREFLLKLEISVAHFAYYSPLSDQFRR